MNNIKMQMGALNALQRYLEAQEDDFSLRIAASGLNDFLIEYGYVGSRNNVAAAIRALDPTQNSSHGFRIQKEMLGQVPRARSNLEHRLRSFSEGVPSSVTGMTLARIHRRRASGQRPESVRKCSFIGKKVLLCFWDNGFRDRRPTPEKEHPIDATTQPSRPHPSLDADPTPSFGGFGLRRPARRGGLPGGRNAQGA